MRERADETDKSHSLILKRWLSQKEHSWKGSSKESESSNERECQQRLCLFAVSGRTEEVGLKAEADTGGDDLSADDVRHLLKASAAARGG